MKEKIMINIEKVIKLRDQIRAAIKIQEMDKAKYEGDDEAHPALCYHRGMLHGLNDFEARLNDMIIGG